MKDKQKSMLISAAVELAAKGFSVVPVNAEKRARGSWKRYQTEIADEGTIRSWRPAGIAVVGGKVSGNLCQMDFEAKDSDGNPMPCVFDEWRRIIPETLYARLSVATTRSGGRHARWRVAGPVDLRRLELAWAMRGEKRALLIETRDERHYCLVPPSPGYEWLENPLADRCAVLTRDEHETLISAARTFNRAVESEAEIALAGRLPAEPAAPESDRAAGGNRPGDDFNRRGDRRALLETHGWTLATTRSDGVELWRRPGTENAYSATWDAIPGRFYCFSPNAAGLEADRTYDLFGLYVRLNHEGDTAAAAKALADEGYGEAPRKAELRRQPSGSPDVERLGGSSEPPYSDPWVADRFVALHGDDCRWCEVWRTWLVWDGKRWLRDESLRVKLKIEEVVRTLPRLAREMDTDDAGKMLKFAAKSLNRIEQIETASRRRLPVMPDVFDRDPELLNCANGVVNLRTGEIAPHDRALMITRLAPVDYRPDARSDRFDAFLERVLPDEEVRGFVGRAAGYSITGYATEEVLFFPYGDSNTGKSTLLRAVQGVLGDYAATADFEALLEESKASGAREQLARLRGRRYVLSVEIKESAKLAENILKWITGQDVVVARHLYGHSFEFLPAFTLWIASNHRPRADSEDNAVWRRIHQLPFDVVIPESDRDPGLKTELSAGNPAVLAWAVAGAIEWFRNGLGVPAAVKAATADYRESMNPLRPFFDERCTFAPGVFIGTTELWENYEQWADDSGIRYPLTRQQFSERVGKQPGVEKKRKRLPDGKNVQAFIGVDLTENLDGIQEEFTDVPSFQEVPSTSESLLRENHISKVWEVDGKGRNDGTPSKNSMERVPDLLERIEDDRFVITAMEAIGEGANADHVILACEAYFEHGARVGWRLIREVQKTLEDEDERDES